MEKGMMIKNGYLNKKIGVFLVLLVMSIVSSANPMIYNIADFGAKGDGSTLNTKAIQSAIDDCAKGGGGTVFFPAGKYLSGTLFLKSHITLRLESGVVLVGSKNLGDYPITVPKVRSYTDNFTDKSLIYGEGLEHIAIIGQGTLDGSGTSFSPSEDLRKRDLEKWYKSRPYMIRIINCKNVLVKGVTFINSPMWVQHYLACEDVNIDGITVNSRLNVNNYDGIDVDGCNRVRISNCDINSGDDAIVLKSTLDRPCKNVTITNCVLSSLCNAFKLGTESNGGFQNINLSNCAIYDTDFAGIALEMVDGEILDQISISNVTMDNVGTAIFIRLGNRARPFNEKSAKPGMGKLSNVIISNVQATNVGKIGCSITGLPGHPVKNITLENIRLKFKGGGTPELVNREIPEIPAGYPEFDMFGILPAYGFYCRHAENLTLNDVELDFIEPEVRPAIICDDITGVEIYKIKARVSGNEPLIACKDVRNMFIQSCVVPKGIETFLHIRGAKSEHITLLGNDLSGAVNAIRKDNDVEVFLGSNRMK